MFSLFDNLPLIYCVYHVTEGTETTDNKFILFYVNHKFEEAVEAEAINLLGRSMKELYPFLTEDWYENIKRAALKAEATEGILIVPKNKSEKLYKYSANQIIYPGYCAVIYQELN